MRSTFDENEIPYEKFEKIGLSQEMVDDLPEMVMKKLLGGHWSPILPICIGLDDDMQRVIQARIKFERRDGFVDILIAPRSEMADLEDFTPEEQNTLRSGKIIITKMPGKEQCFVQLDDKTNRVFYIPVSLMENNLVSLQNELELSNEQVAQMCTGNICTISKREGIFTFGFDFLSDGGIKVVNGDREEYDSITSHELPKYSFGIYGCWIKDADDSFKEYVPEENYTEEMQKEFYHLGEENSQKAEQRGIRI
uniref:DUF4099 domain-containing protein n=1 Tax=Prevotella sp. GTC17254 TaxID=3236794 RepID=A0AB33J6R3_9BACT